MSDTGGVVISGHHDDTGHDARKGAQVGGRKDSLIRVLKPRDFPIALVVTIALTLLLTTFVANRVNSYLLADARQEAIQDTESHAEMAGRSLQRQLIQFDVIAQAIRAVIERQPNLSQSEYQDLVAPLVEPSPSVINVGLSSGYIVDRIYPLEGNKPVLGVDYRNLPSQIDGIDHVLKSGITTLVGPIDLVQGGTAFIQRSAYFVEGDGTDASPSSGVISVIIDREKLLSQTLKDHGAEHLDIAIRKLDSNSNPAGLLYGNADVFDQGPVLRSLPIGSKAWQIGLVPSDGWPKEVNASTLVWALSAVTCSVIGFLLLALWTMYKSKRLVENQLRSAINSIDDGFALYDQDDRLVFANDKYASYYNLTHDAIFPGNTFENILRAGLKAGQYSDAIGREEEWLKERLAAHRNPTEPVEQKLADGRWLKVAETRSPEGNTVGFRVDVTELKQAQERAEAANQAKNNFLNIISHELRTPLTSVIGYARFLENLSVLRSYKALEQAMTPGCAVETRKRALAELHSEVASMSNRITTSSDHLLNLINDILDRAQLEAEKIKLHPEPLDLKDLVKTVTTGLEIKAAEKGLTLQTDVAAVPMVADPKRLRQALINVVGNAIKFTESGGIHISSEQDESHVRITVRDTGCGISAEDFEQIFDQFVQVDASVTRRNSGTGLGLAITREIIALHGGTIDVESNLGRGSTFTISIPNNTDELEIAA
ncbi:MAG TPA: ATP-binding protein [Roseovarius sp.]|nr:ATP-binding protein [Roseovarius sp.]